MAARITPEQIRQIESLMGKMSAAKIANRIGMKSSTVAYQIKRLRDATEETDVEEDHEEIEEEEEEEEEADDEEDLDYWKTMAEYWKEKYLDLHSQHIVLVDSLSDE